MKIIFLDIDGVLNSRKCFEEKHFKGWVKICPELVEHLNRIVTNTDARIVVTSIWRLAGLPRIKRTLKNAGVVGKIIGVTPDSTCMRGAEISLWMGDDPEKIFSDYVILDDNYDFLPHQKYCLVQTDSSIGLSRKNADLAINLLGRK